MSDRAKITPNPANTPMRSARFITMFLTMCFLFSLGQFHRSSGAVMTPIFVQELLLGAEQVSVIVGSMFVAQGLLQLPSGILIDRYGSRLVVPVMTFVAVAGCFVIGLSETGVGIMIGRIMLGLGFATSLLGAYTIFVRWGTPEIIATITGRFLFIGCIGGLFATFPLAWAIEVFQWRPVYIGLGVATLIAAVLTYVVVRNTPDEEAGQVDPPVKRQSTLGDSIRGLVSVAMDRRIRPVLSIGLFLYSPLQVLLGIWAGPFLKDVHDMPAIDRSYVLLAMAFAMAVGTLIYGPIERHFNTRRNVVLVATKLICGMFALLAAYGYANVWVSTTLFILITLMAPFFLVVLAHNQVMFASEYASRVVSLVNLLAISGIFVSQYLTGLVIGAVTEDPNVTGSVLGYRLMFALMAVIFLYITLVYRNTKDIPPRSVDESIKNEAAVSP